MNNYPIIHLPTPLTNLEVSRPVKGGGGGGGVDQGACLKSVCCYS